MARVQQPRRSTGQPRRRPGRPPRAQTHGADTGARILQAATELFAKHGFDGVSMRDIAAAVEVDVATVQHHAGTKAKLYDAVFAHMYEAESEALGAAADRVRRRFDEAPGELLAGLHELLDAYLDFVRARPEVTWLWLRRWLEPEQHRELDERYSLPLYGRIGDLLVMANRNGLLTEPDPRYTVRSIVWAVHAHVTAVAAQGGESEGEWKAFRGFAHRLLDGLYGGAG
jgi:AcrR family transcriptional regulator